MTTIDATAASARATLSKALLALLAGTLGFALFSFVTSVLLASSADGSFPLAYQLALMALVYGGCLYTGSCVGRFSRRGNTPEAAMALTAVATALVAGVACGVVVGGGPLVDALDASIQMEDLLRLGATTVASGLIALLFGALLAARDSYARPGRKGFETFIYFEDFDGTIDLRDAIDLRDGAPVGAELGTDDITAGSAR